MKEILDSQLLDSRDVIHRIEYLRNELEGLENEVKAAVLEENDNAEEINELKEELVSLLSLKEMGQDTTSEWDDGATFIREDCFVDYAEELCEDLGYISGKLPSFIEIDWEATAENLKVDYATIEWKGNTYYVRSV